METRRVRALRAKTEFVPGFGQVHFNPDSKNEAVRLPRVPVSAIPRMVELGYVSDDIDGQAANAPAPSSPPDRASEAKGEGETGKAEDVSGEAEDISALRAQYKEVTGSRPFNGWDTEELLKRISEAKGEGETGKAEDVSGEAEDISALRAQYKEVTGSRPFNGWDTEELLKRISEAKGENADDDDGVADAAIDDQAPTSV
ncbi:hypothetical protein GRI39_01985 [Altererythrobacter indicus]|uniref:Uncharacterized protein n=1 Tax=Altericroceibacterium indicum TaxID=374177 RepID=A0A845A8C8_9SPHN|nr:hypothetical protein [Altericroceibacterium indicum]MXP24816.1 hypothetical protein [Altericroceibacterium indicum]